MSLSWSLLLQSIGWKILADGRKLNSVIGGQNTAFFLVTPNEKYSELPRHPVELDTPDECMICHKDDGDPLACDKVRTRSFISTHSPFLPLYVIIHTSVRPACSAISLITTSVSLHL
jgi:hypothetical protein